MEDQQSNSDSFKNAPTGDIQNAMDDGSQSPIAGLLQDKRILIGGVLLVVLLIAVAVFAFSGADQAPEQESTITPGASPTPFDVPTPTYTAELRAAVDEARQASQEFGEQQIELRQEYPWLRRLPLANAKYFVYFNIERATFVGEVHVTPGDNIEELQQEALGRLRNEKQIPVDDFPIEWEIDRQ